MNRKLLGAMLLLLASTGCRACSRCSDNLPPVLDGPYSHAVGRAGSAFTGMVDAVSLSQEVLATEEESAEQKEFTELDESSIEEEITDPLAVLESTEVSAAVLQKPDRFSHPAVSARSQVLQFVRTDD
jgi:hypothetical protein